MLLADTYDEIEALGTSRKRGSSYMITGFVELDQKIMGLHPADLIVMAARPFHGQDQPGPEHRLQHRHQVQQGRGHLQPGDELPGNWPSACSAPRQGQ